MVVQLMLNIAYVFVCHVSYCCFRVLRVHVKVVCVGVVLEFGTLTLIFTCADIAPTSEGLRLTYDIPR